MIRRQTTGDTLRIAKEFNSVLSSDAPLASKISEICQIVERRVGDIKFTFLHHETKTGRLLGSYFYKFEQRYVELYADHFSKINPWVAYWMSQADGTVAASENVKPSSSFCKSEFFADYLRPQKDISAAAGMKLYSAGGSIVHFAWHYAERHADTFDRLFTDVLKLSKETIRQTISLSRDLGSDDRGASDLWMAPLSAAALVIGDDATVFETNAGARNLLGRSEICRVTDGKLFFTDVSAHHRFCSLLAEMRLSASGFGSRILTGGSKPVSIRIYRHSGTRVSGRVTISRPAQWLVIVATRSLAETMARFKAIQDGFDLTPREFELACAIAAGQSLEAICGHSGLSMGTLRGRLKEVFRKTHTNRQAELVTLMYQLL